MSNTRHTEARVVTSWLVWAAGALAAAPAWSQDTAAADEAPSVSLRGTETFIAEYIGDNGESNEGTYGEDDNYFALRNLLYFEASSAMVDAGLRADLALFQGPPRYVPPSHFIPGGSGYTALYYDNDFRIERLHGTVRLGRLSVTMGDFYVSFGRGIALSLIKLDDVGVDNALRGARIEFQQPRRFKLVAVAGVVNALNIEPITHEVLRDDPLDRIAGLRAEWQLLDALSFGAHVVHLSPRYTDEATIDPDRLYVDRSTGIRATSGGVSAEAHVSGLHLYLEADGQVHDNYRAPLGEPNVQGEPGWAGLMELGYDLPPATFKVEVVYYNRWLMEGGLRGSFPNLGVSQPLAYHHMPTLEPVWMIIKSFGNVYGGRLSSGVYLSKLRTDLNFKLGLLKYEGGLLPLGDWGDHPPTLVLHPIIKARTELGQQGIAISAEGGARFERTDEPAPGERDAGHLWHGSLDYMWPLVHPHSLEAKVEVRRHELMVTEGGEPYWVSLETLAYDWSGAFGLTVAHEYSDQTPGVRGEIGAFTMPLPAQHYLWAMASAHGRGVFEGLTARLTGGSQRGGIKCAGGICRTYPDSVGAKLELVYRF